jgi:uncharacterized LabA/DUF88 family protein
MPGNAALLIDLENFYIGREQNHQRSHPDETYEFPVDLDSLCSFAKSIAGDRRLIVQRAYANFNDRRPGVGERRWDYYLQQMPRFLMEQGIEPVQVFRFPGGNNKNAADMKMAMDATVLLQSPSTVDFFVLVTGDSDFIPLVLELKRSGATVFVIGVTHCTKPIFERYCDRFEYFEDLLAVRELKREDSADLERIRTALATLVEGRLPMKFAAVKPLLSDELGLRFDPTRFGSESTGEFLRRYAPQLGIEVRRAEHDWEIVGIGESQPYRSGAPADDVLDDGFTAAAPASEGDADVDPDAPIEDPAADRRSGSAPAEIHAAEFYRDLLRQGNPRCYVVSGDDWNRIVDAIFPLVAGPEGGIAPRIVHQDLLTEVTDQCIESGMADASRKVRDVCFQLFKSGCFHLAEDDAEPGVIDFHWSKPARLDSRIETVDDLVERVWSFLTQLLVRRLDQRGSASSVQVGALTELFAGADPTDEDVAMIRAIAAATAARGLARGGGIP